MEKENIMLYLVSIVAVVGIVAIVLSVQPQHTFNQTPPTELACDNPRLEGDKLICAFDIVSGVPETNKVGAADDEMDAEETSCYPIKICIGRDAKGNCNAWTTGEYCTQGGGSVKVGVRISI